MTNPRAEAAPIARPGTGSEASAARAYSFGSFRIDITTYELHRDGELIAISPKAFDALLMLVRNRDRAVGKDELMDSVWPDANVTEDSLTQCISTLRRALGDDSNHPKFIATVARRGYRFIAPVDAIPGSPAAASPDAAPAGGRLIPAELDAPRPAAPPIAVPRISSRASWMVGLAAAVLIAAGLIALFESRQAPAGNARAADLGKLRFTVDAPEGIAFGSGAVLAPNGSSLAFAAEDDRSGSVRLWVRSLESANAHALAGTEGASRPFWSPDSRFLGFFADGKLKRVGLDNGPPLVVADLGTYSAGGTWGKSGVILFADQRSGIYSVPDSGGSPTPVTTLDPSTQEVAHRWPQFLPDGEHFLFYRTSGRPEQAGTYVGSLHSRATTRLLGSLAVYAPGSLLYVRDRLLTAQGFDAAHLKLSGASSIVDASILTAGNANEAGVSASDNGLLAFGGSPTQERPVWFDRSGRQLAAFDTPTAVHNPALSPDRKQLLVGSREVDHGIWMVDLDRDAATRVVPDGMRPQWSPDGSRIVYTADRIANVGDIFIKSMAGGNGDELLFRSKENKMVDDWSPDGKYIVYASINPQTKTDLWMLPLSGDRKPQPFLQTPADELQGQIAPDGHWIAYTSDESGAWEVYLQSFPAPGAKRTISIGGGTEPHWRRDGRELFYLSADRTLMSVNVTLGASATIGRPRPLFRAAVPSNFSVFRNHYAVAADGQRFMICAIEHKGKEDLITVLANWDPAAKR